MSCPPISGRRNPPSNDRARRYPTHSRKLEFSIRKATMVMAPERTAKRAVSRRTPIGMNNEVFSETFEKIRENCEKVIQGKANQIRMVLTALIADGHVLLEDMPGTGKTMMA